MEITYLLNSGFLIRDDRTLLVFDDFEDPSKAVDRAVSKGDFDNFYIFASHAHFDHFSTHIRAYSDKVTRYIFSNDIRRTKRVKIFPSEKITFLKRYSQWNDENIQVTTFDSTDIGVSFLIELSSGRRIFHAGDFNFWYWEGDMIENQLLAEKAFTRQLKQMTGLNMGLVFFPIDGRLGASQEAFLKAVEAEGIIAMHRVGYSKWQPSENFFENGEKPFWSPITPGESRVFNEGSFK